MGCLVFGGTEGTPWVITRGCPKTDSGMPEKLRAIASHLRRTQNLNITWLCIPDFFIYCQLQSARPSPQIKRHKPVTGSLSPSQYRGGGSIFLRSTTF